MDGLVLGWRSLLLLVLSAHLLIAGILLVQRRFERSAHRYLAALMAVIALYFVPQIIGFAGFYDRWPQLSFTPFALDLFVGPLIWAYAWSLTRTGRPWPGLWLWAPGTLELVYGLVMMVQSLETKAWWVSAVHHPYIVPVETVGGLALLIGGVAGAYRLYQRYTVWLGTHSSAAAEFDPRWLRVFLIACAGLLGLALIRELALIFTPDLTYFQLYPFHVLVGLVFYALALAALIMHREAFPKPSLGTAPTASASQQPDADEITDAEGDKDTEVGTGRDWGTAAAALRLRIETEGWHLEPRLSAPDLARRLGTNETYLSRTINQGAGMNFNRFINTLRVERVQADLVHSDADILALALDNGFNSKATFNRVFRDITGETPAACRARLRSAA